MMTQELDEEDEVNILSSAEHIFEVMLSTEYRLRLEFICSQRIAKGEEVQLSDMIWADKLGKANRSANEMLRKARQKVANNPDMQEGSLDSFMNAMDLGDPDPNHRTMFSGADDIVEWFSQENDEAGGNATRTSDHEARFGMHPVSEDL